MARIPKPKRLHLPRLDRLQLEAFQARLEALQGVSQEGKAAVMLSMRAAANPNAESPETVIKTLPDEMRQEIAFASQGYAQTLTGVQSRGAAALMMDMEFDSLLALEGDE